MELTSWNKVPLANFMDMAAHLINNAKQGVPASRVLCTQFVARIFGCHHEFARLIGRAVRNYYKFRGDLESYGTTNPERVFQKI
jgi:hypothetical protein